MYTHTHTQTSIEDFEDEEPHPLSLAPLWVSPPTWGRLDVWGNVDESTPTGFGELRRLVRLFVLGFL